MLPVYPIRIRRVSKGGIVIDNGPIRGVLTDGCIVCNLNIRPSARDSLGTVVSAGNSEVIGSEVLAKPYLFRIRVEQRKAKIAVDDDSRSYNIGVPHTSTVSVAVSNAGKLPGLGDIGAAQRTEGRRIKAYTVQALLDMDTSTENRRTSS